MINEVKIATLSSSEDMLKCYVGLFGFVAGFSCKTCNGIVKR